MGAASVCSSLKTIWSTADPGDNELTVASPGDDGTPGCYLTMALASAVMASRHALTWAGVIAVFSSAT